MFQYAGEEVLLLDHKQYVVRQLLRPVGRVGAT